MGYDTASGPTLWTPPDTSAPETDKRTHWRLLADLIETQVGDGRVFAYGEVDGSFANGEGPLPDIYVLLSVERRYVGPRRAGRSGRSGWRATTRFDATTLDEAMWADEYITRAIEEARLKVGEYWSTPVALESDNGIEFDKGRYSGLSLWTYVL